MTGAHWLLPRLGQKNPAFPLPSLEQADAAAMETHKELPPPSLAVAKLPTPDFFTAEWPAEDSAISANVS